MAERNPEEVVNFAAGPAKLPREVVIASQKGVLNYNGTGIGVMELSHRSKEYAALHNETIELLRKLMNVPSNYKILLLQGGGTLQFSAIPLNITESDSEVADYLITGNWSTKAAQEAEKYLKVNKAIPKRDKYDSIPPKSEWKLSNNASYVYYCDNETAYGVEFPDIPDVGDKLLVCDMSSNFLTRSVDVSKFGLIFAGAQKNFGCAGVVVVIVREDLLGKPRNICPIITNYTIQAANNSLYNTPCTWATYVMNLVLKWVESQGGVPGMQECCKQKSEMIYGIIHRSNGFYELPVAESCQSRVNVPFRVGPEDQREKLEAEFLKQAESKGLLQLKGYRLVGGVRASMYNSLSVDEVKRLADFMSEFMLAKQNES